MTSVDLRAFVRANLPEPPARVLEVGAGADLEHARGRRREGGADERDDAGVGRHAAHRTAPPAARTSSSARSTSPGVASIPREAAVSRVTAKPSRSASSAVARTQ